MSFRQWIMNDAMVPLPTCEDGPVGKSRIHATLQRPEDPPLRLIARPAIFLLSLPRGCKHAFQLQSTGDGAASAPVVAMVSKFRPQSPFPHLLTHYFRSHPAPRVSAATSAPTQSLPTIAASRTSSRLPVPQCDILTYPEPLVSICSNRSKAV